MVDYSETLRRLGEEYRDDNSLSVEDIILLHDKMVEKYGGALGVIDYNLLESVAVAPYQECFGEVLYPSIYDKAAKYLFDFSNYQIFRDGNKRTGVAACEKLLRDNGYALTLSPEKLYQTVLDIANHVLTDSSEVAPLIKDNVEFTRTKAFSVSVKDDSGISV